MKLTPDQNEKLQRCLKIAQRLELIPLQQYQRENFNRRARAAFKRNLIEPGDCAGDIEFLAALAVAQAQLGIRPGWIPEVQRIAYEIVSANPNPTTPAAKEVRA